MGYMVKIIDENDVENGYHKVGGVEDAHYIVEQLLNAAATSGISRKAIIEYYDGSETTIIEERSV